MNLHVLKEITKQKSLKIDFVKRLMKLTPLKLDKKQRQGGRGCLTHIEDFPYLNLCIYVYWSWNKGEDFMLNISYSSVFVDSSGDNSLYAVCSRLEICTVHWVSLVPGYLWSRYLHFSCQQEKKLLSLFSWMWELTNFFFLQNVQWFVF